MSDLVGNPEDRFSRVGAHKETVKNFAPFGNHLEELPDQNNAEWTNIQSGSSDDKIGTCVTVTPLQTTNDNFRLAGDINWYFVTVFGD